MADDFRMPDGYYDPPEEPPEREEIDPDVAYEQWRDRQDDLRQYDDDPTLGLDDYDWRPWRVGDDP